MQLIQFKKRAEPIDLEGGCGLCLGHFDGVHVGHRALFAQLRRLNAARERRLPLGVLCFTTPPAATLSKAPIPQLTTLDEKLALIKDAGLDFAVLYGADNQVDDLMEIHHGKHDGNDPGKPIQKGGHRRVERRYAPIYN